MSSSPPHPTPPEAVHCVALWTRITLCFGHVSSMTQKSEKTMHFWEKIKRVSQLWQRQKHCSQWYECWVWVLGHTCCRNPVKRCLICPKTCVSYGENMMKNARDQAPGRKNFGQKKTMRFRLVHWTLATRNNPRGIPWNDDPTQIFCQSHNRNWAGYSSMHLEAGSWNPIKNYLNLSTFMV